MTSSPIPAVSRSWLSRGCGLRSRGLHASPQPRTTSANRSCPTSPDPKPARAATRISPLCSGAGVTQVITEFRLKPTAQSGRLARLRRMIPVMLHHREPEPAFVIPLAGAAGKTFPCSEVELTIQSAQTVRNGTLVACSAKLDVAKADLPDHPGAWLIMGRLNMVGAPSNSAHG